MRKIKLRVFSGILGLGLVAVCGFAQGGASALEEKIQHAYTQAEQALNRFSVANTKMNANYKTASAPVRKILSTNYDAEYKRAEEKVKTFQKLIGEASVPEAQRLELYRSLWAIIEPETEQNDESISQIRNQIRSVGKEFHPFLFEIENEIRRSDLDEAFRKRSLKYGNNSDEHSATIENLLASGDLEGLAFYLAALHFTHPYFDEFGREIVGFPGAAFMTQKERSAILMEAIRGLKRFAPTGDPCCSKHHREAVALLAEILQNKEMKNLHCSLKSDERLDIIVEISTQLANLKGFTAIPALAKSALDFPFRISSAKGADRYGWHPGVHSVMRNIHTLVHLNQQWQKDPGAHSEFELLKIAGSPEEILRGYFQHMLQTQDKKTRRLAEELTAEPK